MLLILAGYFRYGFEFGSITTYVNGSYSLYARPWAYYGRWQLTMFVALLFNHYLAIRRHGEDSEYSIVCYSTKLYNLNLRRLVIH